MLSLSRVHRLTPQTLQAYYLAFRNGQARFTTPQSLTAPPASAALDTAAGGSMVEEPLIQPAPS